MIGVISLFGDDLPMNLKELKKLADTLDDNGKRELIYFLQSLKKVDVTSPNASHVNVAVKLNIVV